MIHQYKNNGHNIVLDVHSGAVHEVDDLMYDAISIYRSGILGYEDIKELHPELSREEFDEVRSELEELNRQGMLFSKDEYEDKLDRVKKLPVVVKALCLHVAHACNLSCRYCFAEEGKYHGQENELMSFETGKAALDFLVKNSGMRKNLEVDFFGGEPLLNFEVVKKLVEYGRSLEKEHDKLFRFTLTTNGVLLTDEVMDFCDREMKNVVLSIDGRKEINDKMRPFHDGGGSYDTIMPKIVEFAKRRQEKGLEYYVRGTYTHFNTDFAKDVLHLADLGIKQISVEPVVASPEEEYAIREEDLPKIKSEYDKLAKEMAKRAGTDSEFNFFHFMIDLEGGPCVYKRLSGCGSGTEYLACTPKGELFPCHQFVGLDGFKMGDVYDGVKNDNMREKFRGLNVYSRKECRDCFARYYCSGGCAANAYNLCGDIAGAYPIGCELQKKRIECAIMLKVHTNI